MHVLGVACAALCNEAVTTDFAQVMAQLHPKCLWTFEVNLLAGNPQRLGVLEGEAGGGDLQKTSFCHAPNAKHRPPGQALILACIRSFSSGETKLKSLRRREVKMLHGSIPKAQVLPDRAGEHLRSGLAYWLREFLSDRNVLGGRVRSQLS